MAVQMFKYNEFKLRRKEKHQKHPVGYCLFGESEYSEYIAQKRLRRFLTRNESIEDATCKI